jgi:hypothetical protein
MKRGVVKEIAVANYAEGDVRGIQNLNKVPRSTLKNGVTGRLGDALAHRSR